jgi:DNA repair protein RadD
VIHLRGFQADVERRIYAAWGEGARVVMPVLPTGAGKTVLFSKIAADARGAVAAVAHRSELVSQISLALARNGVRHRVIGQKSLQRLCGVLHMQELGRSFYDAGARVAAAGVDTMIRHKKEHDSWARQVQIVIEDEGHHVLQNNKWGEAFEMFPTAYGLFPTATPRRADGKGLGRHADGLVDRLIVGPSMRDLINEGYLTDYRIAVAPTDIDYASVPVGSGGELNMVKLREAVHKSPRIVGDVVTHYKRFADGKLGVTFAVDVEAATELASAYRKAGIPAEVVSAKTPDSARFAILRKFRNREILQLCNVDLFGEGFDLPAIEVVSLVRRTESFSLFCQQFGRALRLMLPADVLAHWDSYTVAQRRAFIAASTKPKAIIIDHVGNVARHGLPDTAREWSLDRRERRSRGGPDDAIPVRSCPQCLAAYLRVLRCCPECGHYAVPLDRSTPEKVDGDLIELDPATLAQLRGEIDRINSAARMPAGLDAAAQGAIMRRHYDRQNAQGVLRAAIALWAGWQRVLGRPDSEAYRRFFFTYGTDVATAQTLSAREAGELCTRITQHLNENGVIAHAI